MNNTFLYTLPQWFIFAAIFVAVYGWVEDKRAFRLIGAGIFVALGIYSLYILSGDYLAAGKFLTPGEIADEELLDEVMEEVPFEAQLLPAYVSFLVSAAIALPAIYFDLRNRKIHRLFIVLAGLVSLFGFFIVVGTLKSL